MSTQPLEANAVVLKWEWALKASPAELWPFVSDTNRINIIAGMSPVRFTEHPRPEGPARRVGHSKLLGFPVSWDEHPFRWVYPESFQVLRSFHSGPLSAYLSKVVLTAEGTGTRLTHTVRIVPRSWMLSPFVKAEGAQLQKKWERAYRAIDAYLAFGGPHPFGAPVKKPHPEPVRSIVERLEAQGQDPALVAGLVEFVLGAHETELQHLRPFMLADRWRAPRTQVLELLMAAAAHGLLEARWSHLCPQCRGPKASADHPDRLAEAASCVSCGITFERAGEENIELAFRPAPAVREITGVTYCVGGPGATPHVLFQDELAPGARLELALPVEPGLYRLRSALPKGEAIVHYLGAEGPAREAAAVRVTEAGVLAPADALAGETLKLALESEAAAVQVVLERTAMGSEIATAHHVRATPSYQAFMQAGSKA